MVRISYEQKPYRRSMMQTFGARSAQSRRTETHAGRMVLAEDPDSHRQPRHRHQRGGRGRRRARGHELLARQRAQPRAAAPDRDRPGGDQADGDGRRVRRMSSSAARAAARNFAGIAFPFLRERSCAADAKTRFLAVEPASCPSLTQGEYRYDFGDTAGMTPLLKMYTLGHDFVPGADPRRRAALSRRWRRWSATSTSSASSRRRRMRRTPASTRRSSSLAPRASSQRRSRPCDPCGD